MFRSPAEPDPIRGPDGFKRFVDRIRGSFPDVHVSIEDMLAEGDLVAVRLTMTMTHTAPYQGLPATGRRLTGTQILIDRVADGRIVETWQEVDALGIMQQLGAVPPPGIGPLGLIRWAFATVGRFAVLGARGAR